MRVGRRALCCVAVLAVSCTSPPPPHDGHETRAAPRGYIAFCTREPGFCDGRGPARIGLTSARWAELLRVNDGINDSLKPREDRAPVGMADDWTIPTGALGADCEDFVLAKKQRLMALGWPGPALRIAVVEEPGRWTDRRRHAVLLADTDQGIFVLDNLTRTLTRASEAGYRWIEVQVSTNPDRWERNPSWSG